MITTQLNPGWLEPAAYIEFLNRVFPGQWDRASRQFYGGRSFCGRSPDVAVRADGRRILSGAFYCFRQIRCGDAEPIDVSVMSAAATLGSERGRGHYRELLETQRELCRARSYAAILGFVTRENASARGLRQLGAYSIPSFYVVSGARPIRPRPIRRSPCPWVPEPRPALTAPAGDDRVRFHYPSEPDWRQQFLQRPHPERAFRLSHDVTAIVETVGATDRLQWLGCPSGKVIASIARLAAASAATHRKFFMYTLDPLLAAAASRLGLSIRPGLLMLLPVDRDRTDWQRLAAADWCLHSGDRV